MDNYEMESDSCFICNKKCCEEIQSPIKKCETLLAFVFLIIGLFCLITSLIVLFQFPVVLLSLSKYIVYASLPFLSFNESVIGIIPTSVLFLVFSLGMFLLKNQRNFKMFQFFILIVCIISVLYYFCSC